MSIGAIEQSIARSEWSIKLKASVAKWVFLCSLQTSKSLPWATEMDDCQTQSSRVTLVHSNVVDKRMLQTSECSTTLYTLKSGSKSSARIGIVNRDKFVSGDCNSAVFSPAFA
ncbi:Uncharacterized protein HZ326_13315 [Fusarium oxysporum f. sp. albedinis]|nr:Uncharacterized protein HZ326_13315 [Fusarium oxysporum f. sp. albedinis]